MQLLGASFNHSVEHLHGQSQTHLDNHSAVRAASWTAYLNLNTLDPQEQTGQSNSSNTGWPVQPQQMFDRALNQLKST